MFYHYFIVALRNIKRHKLFSLITVSGLSIGISASLVIYLIVHYNFSFDDFHKDKGQIYRVVSDFRFSGEEYHNGGVPAPLYKAVQEEVTGIKQVTGFYTIESNVQLPAVKGAPVVFKKERNIIFTDDAYFRFFPRQWLAGSANTALQQPNQVVISEAVAKKYFPGLDYAAAIGRQIIYSDTLQTTVSGVLKDVTEPTDFVFNQFISIATIQTSALQNSFGLSDWDNTNSASQLWVKLAPATTTEQVHGQLKKLMQKYKPEDNKAENSAAAWRLQPLDDLHFNNIYGAYGLPLVNKTTQYGLITVALFLLLLGCINFINLTTAQAVQRTKEIGIRKTIGGSKKQLLTQFLTETLIVTFCATLLSVLLTPWALKIFADYIPSGVQFQPLQQVHVLYFLIGLTLLVTLLSGTYPAFILARFKPVMVLKNQTIVRNGNTRSALLRKVLTVSQFVIAQVFVMATVLVSKQIHYSQTKEMGFKKEAILSFNIPFEFQQFQLKQKDGRQLILQQKIGALPGVESVSIGGPPPASFSQSSSGLKYVDGKREVETDVQLKKGDTAFLRLYGIQLLAGRTVRESDSTTEYVINETYAKQLGFKQPEDAIGKSLMMDDKTIPIVGVMSDFHQKSLHEPIKPLAFSSAAAGYYTFHVALKPQQAGNRSWQSTIAGMEKEYKALYPQEDFQYRFFDESIAQFYKGDEDISKLLGWATGLSVLISCLGLLGLVIYTTHQRSKEIGIRKVLGATVTQIVAILSKDFILLVIISFVIAVPAAWWVMDKWLQNFAYRTSINWWVFGVSGIAMMVLALLVLSVRTIKAALNNPVNSLRSE